MEICQGKRGTFIDMQYLDETRVTLTYEIRYQKSYMTSSIN